MKKFFAISYFLILVSFNLNANYGGWNWNVTLNNIDYPSGANLGSFNPSSLILKGGWGNSWQNGEHDICHMVIDYSVVGGVSGSLIIYYVSPHGTTPGDKYHSKKDYSIDISNLSAGTYTLNIDYKLFGRNGYVSCGTSGNANEFTSNALNTQAYTFTVNAPLPVKFGAIEAVKDQNGTKISWATFSEAYSDYFDVQYSADGKYFTSVGRVKSLANGTQEALYYDFVDQYRDHSTIYYRIKQVDFDGKFTYSPMISLRKNVVYNDVKIFPNPTRDVINVTGVKPTSSLTIFDMNGRIVKSFTGGQSSLDIQELTAGVYILEILDEDGRHFYKVIRD
ncbi:MAG: T9SS type A sorting domain-containing protein [Saprospiraceae bacterium]|nr:T9SS type A sorting domain-containing protein [Saprospiraceae bacterium]